MVKFGSARISENGTINGIKGDQKGGAEVSIQNFYMSTQGWICMRAISEHDAINLFKTMIDACNNDFIGYGQSDRDDVFKQVKAGTKIKNINVPCNCDCSSLVRACIYEAMGIDVGNFNTASEVSMLSKSGKFVQISINSEKDCQIGDILVTKGKGHTVIVVEGYSRATISPNLAEKIIKVEFNTKELKKGSKGDSVRIWQFIVGVETDGDFGKDTDHATRNFQKAKGLVVDGIVGQKTWKAGLES